VTLAITVVLLTTIVMPPGIFSDVKLPLKLEPDRIGNFVPTAGINPAASFEVERPVESDRSRQKFAILAAIGSAKLDGERTAALRIRGAAKAPKSRCPLRLSRPGDC